MPGKSKPGGGLKVSATYKRKKAKKTTTKKKGKGKGMY
mgnify:CR=1 FL=1|tara:strand:- start:417 stop:530 length:114 start_codon:yes stop_codon:yes gene_type:complete